MGLEFTDRAPDCTGGSIESSLVFDLNFDSKISLHMQDDLHLQKN